MGLMNVFVGAPQSKFAAIAIFFAIAVVAFAILIGKEPIPMGQRFMFILIMFLVSLPGLLVTLFQLTCLVTGAGLKNQRWWCSLYAWIGSVLIILYSVILVVAAVMSMLQGQSMMKELALMEQYKEAKDHAEKAAKEKANLIAKEMFEDAVKPPQMDEMPKLPKMEGYANEPLPVPMMKKPVMESFEEEEYDEEIAPMEPETFSSCGAPIPSSA